MRVLQGARSQFHKKLENAGVQCTAIAAVSCCLASEKLLSEWDAEHIDECLKVIKSWDYLWEASVPVTSLNVNVIFLSILLQS